MKNIMLTLMTTICLHSFAQEKSNYIHYNNLTEIKGTEFVIASIENWEKSLVLRSEYLLFINTKSGEKKQIEFSDDAKINKFEQIKIDSLNLNLIIVSAKTIDLDLKNGINWNDPTQLIVLSPDGNTKTQLTENQFFTSTWAINKLTGTIVVTGHFDSNNNNKYDKTDKSEIRIYDLKTLQLLSTI